MLRNKQTVKYGKFTFIDLFAGIGGFRLALEKFGGNCVFSSDIDRHCQETYRENFGDKPYGDITKIDSKDIANHDVLCAGFPCQPFSVSGKQLGFNDARGTLFYDIMRITQKHKPKVLFLENVGHFEKHDNGRTLHVVLKLIKDAGYNAFYKILNASDFGIPQSRKRIYIVAFRTFLDVKKFEFPTPSYEKVKLSECLESDPDVGKQIINNPEKYVIKFNKEILEKSHQTVEFTFKPMRIGTINNGGQGERIYSTQGHAVTITATTGGIASKTGAYLIDGVVRKLTPRECARLMGFPDSFKICENTSQAYKQFGNSVVVTLLEKIFGKIMEKYIVNERNT